jgi:hypothetical protein
MGQGLQQGLQGTSRLHGGVPGLFAQLSTRFIDGQGQVGVNGMGQFQ